MNKDNPNCACCGDPATYTIYRSVDNVLSNVPTCDPCGELDNVGYLAKKYSK